MTKPIKIHLPTPTEVKDLLDFMDPHNEVPKGHIESVLVVLSEMSAFLS